MPVNRVFSAELPAPAVFEPLTRSIIGIDQHCSDSRADGVKFTARVLMLFPGAVIGETVIIDQGEER